MIDFSKNYFGVFCVLHVFFLGLLTQGIIYNDKALIYIYLGQFIMSIFFVSRIYRHKKSKYKTFRIYLFVCFLAIFFGTVFDSGIFSLFWGCAGLWFFHSFYKENIDNISSN